MRDVLAALGAVVLNNHHSHPVALAAPHVTRETLAPTIPYLTEHEKRCDTVDDEQWRVLRLNNHFATSSLGPSLVATQTSISHHVRQWREKHELFFCVLLVKMLDNTILVGL